jgi:hypothetical protein
MTTAESNDPDGAPKEQKAKQRHKKADAVAAAGHALQAPQVPTIDDPAAVNTPSAPFRRV